MKKYFILAGIMLAFGLLVVADDDVFVQKFRNCASYSSHDNVEVSGIKAVSTKSISGWQNGKCSYEERVNMMGIDSVVSCSFTKSQVAELSEVMDAYNTLQKYSKEDISTLEEAEKNPVAKAWNKYLNDPSVCSISTGTPQ